MKRSMFFVGMFLVIVGSAWIGQATGIFPYPAGNIMNNHIEWAYRGGSMLVLGIILIVFSRSGPRK